MVEFEVEGREPGPSKRSSGAGLGKILKSPAARVVVIIVCIAAVGFGLTQLIGGVAGPSNNWPRVRIMHVDTGQLRWLQTGPNATMPDGYHPVEYCFQNQCGPEGGTPVILNEYIGKPEQTNCSKCGARVVGHNPRPKEYEGVIPTDWRR
ncbi:MAG: DUF1206 domain-containing protein [Phycisphaeraceae bacterium]|nr:MAG: DUF1206 domain-containing protein [Phycisphaeraceae bacterium]